ncbi:MULTISPECIES: SMI1/KNR4 family protein [Nocardia]|uniref:SMI1/KNR4 family protein n=1 Tax=Nocardia TaxID=1817 RepID=UPI001895B54D|nr:MULTISPECIES: SMI1/KNR4 family protein [Nocardia]MBF6347677.1 SMI1/KNR4 family protein [Nocardia flavorosea]
MTRLDRWLAANRPEYYAALRPGAADTDIHEITTRVGSEIPPLLRELLTWRNGQDRDYRGTLLALWDPLSADEIAAALDMFADLVANDDFADQWGEGWIPFLGNVYGDHICIDLRGAFDGEPGQIVVFHCKDEFRDIVFPSLEAWLETLVIAFETGMAAKDDPELQNPYTDDELEAWLETPEIALETGMMPEADTQPQYPHANDEDESSEHDVEKSPEQGVEESPEQDAGDDPDIWRLVDDDAYEAFCASRYPGYPRTVTWPDYSRAPDPAPAGGPAAPIKGLLHSLDMDRLRSVLRESGHTNPVIDEAFDRLSGGHDPGDSTREC